MCQNAMFTCEDSIENHYIVLKIGDVVPQDIPLKQRIFADLEAVCRPDAILSSNTSTIDISLIGKKTQSADRIVGAHFFSPAHIMPLLEIVRTKQTSKQVNPLPAPGVLNPHNAAAL